MSIDTEFTAVRRDVEVVLARLDPEHEAEWRSDMKIRFDAWSAIPTFAIECGVLKLACEFYFRAAPDRMRRGFHESRNVMLDYLNGLFGFRPDIHVIDESQWAQVLAFLHREFPV
ncbi:MAG: hypothetical protein QM790_16445 [Nibricoccus sp.]